MELLHENGGPDDDIEFKYESGEFVEVLYSTPEQKPLPLRKKSTKFLQLQNFPYLSAFIQKVCA